MNSFEQAFAGVQKSAEAAGRAARDVAKAAKALATAAHQGDIPKLRRAIERLARAQDTAAQEVTNAGESWPFPEEEEETYLRDCFADELVKLAKTEGLQIFPLDADLVVFPSVLRVLSAERAVRIDRKRVAAIRPSHLIATLKSSQSKKSTFEPARFIEALHGAYQALQSAEQIDDTVPLARVYELLTLLPGVNTDYDKSAFGRDLLMLSTSGVIRSKSGAIISFPSSTATKGSRGIFSAVGRDGTLIRFYGIRFAKDTK